jgi:catechol 2,3-dioxygenase-like lactoylglutathione lyase family enzyme
MTDTVTRAVTRGVHHVGLAVPDLPAAERFFVEALGWSVVGGVPSYPAVFVSDGATMVTLWRVADPGSAAPFDRRTQVGLHHLALGVADRAALALVHERVRAHPGVAIEFAPAPMREGSSVHHFICAMPGGIRLEFATAPA